MRLDLCEWLFSAGRVCQKSASLMLQESLINDAEKIEEYFGVSL